MRAEAQRLYEASLAAELYLKYGDQERALRAAARADPTYYPAVFDLAIGRPAPLVSVAAFLDSIAAVVSDAGVGACIAEAAADYRGTQSARPRPAILTDEAHACLDYAVAVNSSGRTADELAALRRSLARFPAAPRLIAAYVAWGHSARRFRDVAERARQFTSARYGPTARAAAWYVLAAAEHGLDHDDRAAAAERAALDDPAARLPGYRATIGEALAGHGSIPALAARADVAGLARHADSLRTLGEAITAAAAQAADPAARIALVAADAVRRLDRGQINEAIAALASIREDAEGLGDPGRTAYVLMRLGRALVKGGRAHDAERVLLEARAVGRPAGLPETQKEIEHNLLHLYESLGRADDAEAAGEEFMRLAGMGRLDPVRMMSVRDFGMFLRSRGRVAESAPYFARMLADIDTLQYEWYYAGEYLELTGQLDDARRYYERAYDVEHEPIRTMEGLIRLSLATGDTASARHWAEMHDARRDAAGRPESRPLLPTVLRRSGTTDAARRAFA
ncbi:MAG: hypothetical protein U9Q74_15610, partial [Gemmatimonadota bacterium]|nr:hypothetical protein [Gemmatimonadota bacterium]